MEIPVSCQTRPGPAAYCKFIEEHTGETVKQTDWHELKKMAQEDGYEMSRKKMPEKSSLFTASQLANALGVDDDAKAALKQQVEGMKNTQGTLSILDYMARKGVKESLAEARRRTKGEDEDRSRWEMQTMVGGLSYEDRVAKLEDEGIPTSDAQAIVEAQDIWERQQREAAEAKAAQEAMIDEDLDYWRRIYDEDAKLSESVANSSTDDPDFQARLLENKRKALHARDAIDKIRAERASQTIKAVALTPASGEVFLQFVEDAPNWSGNPWVSGGNIELTKEQRGNLADLVKKDLVEVKEEDMGDGRTMSYLEFTEKGQRLARAYGYDTNW
jgi:hypothetical protein